LIFSTDLRNPGRRYATFLKKFDRKTNRPVGWKLNWSPFSSKGCKATKRSVERDLQTLSGKFTITADEREKPYG